MSKRIQAETTFSLKDDLFNERRVRALAAGLASSAKEHGVRFAPRKFVKRVVDGFAERELKQRIEWIVDVLTETLPDDFDAALELLRGALPPPLDPTRGDDDFGEFIWVAPGEYAARHGCTTERAEHALAFLRESTQRFSAEYAIRPFLAEFPDRTMEFVRDCAHHDHYHVRRLASEGIRPLLPWARRVVLPTDDVLDVLDVLHADPTRYVTRSVANTLNDISKSEPQRVLTTLRRWRKAARQDPDELTWMTRHALRTLTKREHPATLRFLGYPAEPKVSVTDLRTPSRVRVGESFEWVCTLRSDARQRLLVALKVHFLKADGTLAPKVFAVRDSAMEKGESVAIRKQLSFRPMTTRALYPGRHRAELIVNGIVAADREFRVVTA